MNSKKNSLGWLSLILSGTLFLFSQCNSVENNNPTTETVDTPPQETEQITSTLAVRPPLEGVDVPFETYKVPVSEGKTIELESGTVIKIPANAFVDEAGNPIEGEVEIGYREFHDAADLIASGIPMHDPETGQYMETAGMFEIKGSQDGSEIFVQEGKNIDIDLASYNEGNDFDFFRLQKDCHWETLIESEDGQLNPIVNKKRQEKLAKLDDALPPRPIRPVSAAESDNFVFDLDVNYSKFPELKPFNGIIWEYTGGASGENPEANQWIFQVDWDKIQLDRASKEGHFMLSLSQEVGDKSFQTQVRPILKGSDLAKAKKEFEQKMTEHQEVLALQREERERLRQEAKLLRSFSIDGFGTFNCDRWAGMNRVVCQANFEYDTEIDQDINKMTVYLVTSNLRSVIPYRGQNASNFIFVPEERNALVAVLPGNEIAIFSPEDFARLSIENINKETVQTFKLKPTSGKIESVNDLRQIIEKHC